jgi:hypothetical protein
MSSQLEQAIESPQSRLTPSLLKAQVHALLCRGEGVGGGVNAFRSTKH